MLQPWKNPRSEFYWFRRRVPAAALAFMGRPEIKFSLKTKNWDEATLRCQEENLRLERMWHEHLHGRRYDELSQRQLAALAGEFYREMVAAHRDNPGSPSQWETSLREHEKRKRPPIALQPLNVHWRGTFGNDARAFLDQRGLSLVGTTFDSFLKAYVAAKEQAEKHLMKNAAGDYRPDPDADRFPSAEVLKNGGKVPALEVFDRYASEAELSAKTRKAWRAKIRRLIASLKHDDLARLTKKNLVNWKDELLKENSDGKKLNGKTVRNAYLAAVKATLQYAVEQEELPENVAKGITVRIKKKKKQREKGFTLEEAHLILNATLAPPPPKMSAEMAAARRWVPWICAYTGARVNEVTQLTPADIRVEKGFDIIRFDADATKTAEYRVVPLHHHLIEQGFLEYVRSRGMRPLFYDPRRSRGGTDSNPHYQKVGERLAEWVRTIVADERVAPNHGWRHRFSSLARHVDMHVDVQNIIQGHVGDKTASDYGDAWIETAHREISKIPRYEVDRLNGRTASSVDPVRDRIAGHRRRDAPIYGL
jgi:integrase